MDCHPQTQKRSDNTDGGERSSVYSAMSWLAPEDYDVVIDRKSLDAMVKGQPQQLEKAEQAAISEARGYLGKYDTDRIFSQTGSRHEKLVSVITNISVYNLCASLPARAADEVRRQRYEDALAWLKGIQNGTITPDLPYKEDSSGEDGSGMLLGGLRPQNWDW